MDKQRGFLDNCEQEQLQFSGAIQSHGALIICQPDGTVTHRSDNLADFIADSLVAEGSLQPAILKLIPKSEQSPDTDAPVQRLFLQQALDGKSDLLDVVLTHSASRVAIEVLHHEASRAEPPWFPPPGLTAINNDDELAETRHELIDWIARVSGYERVMYYQFLPDGEGEVCSEYCHKDIDGSYLGLRFPASDIPQIARNIYRKNPWRTISDSHSEAVALRRLEPAVNSGHTEVDSDVLPDLTYVDLRSVSPVHAVYMQNMGDRASFTLSVVSADGLDALIFCHSPVAGRLSLDRQGAISNVVRQYNTLLREYRARKRMKIVDEFSYQVNQTLSRMNTLSDVAAQWQVLSCWLLGTFEADCLVIQIGDQIQVAGEETDPHISDYLQGWFKEHCQELFFSTDYLSGLQPDSQILTNMAGAAGLKINNVNGRSDYLFLLRKEVIQEVSWGGNPDKPVEYHDGQLGISPRQSFAKWVEKKIGFSRPWSSDVKFRLLRLRTELQNNGIDLSELIVDTTS